MEWTLVISALRGFLPGYFMEMHVSGLIERFYPSLLDAELSTMFLKLSLFRFSYPVSACNRSRIKFVPPLCLEKLLLKSPGIILFNVQILLIIGNVKLVT